MTTYLTELDVLKLHMALVDLFKDEGPIEPPGPRDKSLLGSACGRPQTSLGGIEKYGTIEEKAAALFHSLVKNHPFHNGNKRTALVATIVFLDENRRQLNSYVSDDDIFEMVTSIAADTFPHPDHGLGDDRVLSELAAWVGRNTHSLNPKPRTMRTTDFLAKCCQAGGTCKEADNGWVVRGPNGKSIRIAGSTKNLVGSVVKTYVSKLGLAGPSAGVYIDEFQGGVPAEQTTLLRFRNVLRRLASA